MQVNIEEKNFTTFISLITEYITDTYNIIPKRFDNLLRIKYYDYYTCNENSLIFDASLHDSSALVCTSCEQFDKLHVHKNCLPDQIYLCTKIEVCAYKIINTLIGNNVCPRDAKIKHDLLIELTEWLPFMCSSIFDITLLTDKAPIQVESHWEPNFLVNFEKVHPNQSEFITFKYYNRGCVFKNKQYFTDCSWIFC